jgi:hypothetical protein
MTDIPEKLTFALTATKGSRKPYSVLPLKVESAPEPSPEIIDAIKACASLDDLGKLWKTTPNKPLYEAAKDARKAELSKPAADPHADFKDELSQGGRI